jgi:hypothetical protein
MNTRSLLFATCGLALFAGLPGSSVQAAEAPARQSASDAYFKALDTDHNGALSPQEFHAGFLGLQRAIAVQIGLREQFRAVDTSHDGALDAGEYARLVLVRRLGKAAPALSGFDADRDQKLDFAEYVTAIRRLAALQKTPAAKPVVRK